MTTQKIVIGRQDVADLPALNIFGIPIKIDTGAYTSSLHCHNIIEFEENGKKKIKCNLLDPEHENYHEKEITFAAFTKKKVKSSNGQVEERYKIKTEIVLFNKTYPISFTLSERGSMRFSVLIGRKFLTHRFVVDTALKNLSLKNNIITI